MLIFPISYLVIGRDAYLVPRILGKKKTLVLGCEKEEAQSRFEAEEGKYVLTAVNGHLRLALASLAKVLSGLKIRTYGHLRLASLARYLAEIFCTLPVLLHRCSVAEKKRLNRDLKEEAQSRLEVEEGAIGCRLKEQLAAVGSVVQA